MGTDLPTYEAVIVPYNKDIFAASHMVCVSFTGLPLSVKLLTIRKFQLIAPKTPKIQL